MLLLCVGCNLKASCPPEYCVPPIYRHIVWTNITSHERFCQYCAAGSAQDFSTFIRGIDIHYHKDRALRWACKYGNYEIARLLLLHGGDLHAKFDKPLKNAVLNKYDTIVGLLLQESKKLDQSLYEGSLIEFLQKLVSIRMDSRWCSRKSRMRYEKILKLLKEYVAYITTYDDDYEFPEIPQS